MPVYNNRIHTFNADVAALQDVINTYNDLVEKRNNLVTTQSDLVHELSSTYKPMK